MVVVLVCASGCGLIFKGSPKGPSAAVPIEIVQTEDHMEPKPQEPPPTMVTPEYVPPAKDGEGTVVVNVMNSKAKVSVVTSTKRDAINVEGQGQLSGGRKTLSLRERQRMSHVNLETRLLCASTPCGFTLPVGSHTLHLEAPPDDANGWDSSTDLYDVTVVPRAKLVTHVMSRARTTTLKPSSRSKGLFADILLETFGWSAVTVGAVLIPTQNDPTAGIVTLAIGAAMIIGGILLYDPGSNRYDKYEYVPSATSFSDYPPH